MKINKKAARKKNKEKVKVVRRVMGRLKLPSNQVIPDKSKETIRKNKYNNGIKELLREQSGGEL